MEITARLSKRKPVFSDYERIFLWFIFYSFAGWAWETVYTLATKHVLQDRGILNGPICPIYGFGALLVWFLLRDVAEPIAVFLSSGVVNCAMEYVTSLILEKWFGVRLWDYSDQPFNINGRISLLGFLGFGLASTLFIFIIHPRVVRQISKIPMKLLNVVSIGIFVLFIADIIVTLLGLLGVNPHLANFDQAVGWPSR